MVKKIVAGVLLLLLLSFTGAFVLFKTKGDVLIEKFSAYVEETTGEPLSIDGVPNLTFLPSPGLELGHATWGRPDGRIYISFSHASVSISAKALLTGKVHITGLNADELDVSIRLDGHPKTLLSKAVAATNYVPQASSEGGNPGVANAYHATSAPNLGQELSRTLERMLNMLPDNVVVSTGRLRVTLPDTSVMTLTNLALKSDNDRSARTVAIVASALGEYTAGTGTPAFTLFKNSTPVSGSISGLLGLNVSASLKASQLIFDLTKASLEPQSGVSFTTPVSLSGKGEYTLTSGALKLQALQAELPGLSASATGAVDSVPTLFSNAMHNGAGTLELKLSGSPRDLLNALGINVNTSNPTALNKANISASAHLREGVVTVSKLDGMVDSTPLSGNLRIGFGMNAARPSLSGELMLGDLNLDALLPQPNLNSHAPPQDSSRDTSSPDGTAHENSTTTEQQKKSVRTITAMAWPELNLSVRVNSLKIKGLTLSEIYARSEGTQGEYTINPLTLRMFGSPITASLKTAVFPKAFPPAENAYAVFSANISASSINLEEAGRYFLNKDILSGMGSLNATLSCASNAPIRTLSGKGSLSAEPLHIKADLLPPNAGIAQQTPVDRVTMGKFDKALLTFVAENGIINIQSASLTAPRMALNGQGNIDLPTQTIDLAGTLQIPGLAVLPVRLAGPLVAPRYSLNAKTTLDAVNRTLQEHGVDVKNEVKRGLRALFKKR